MPVNPDNIAAAQNERFARITPEYVLIYVKRKLNGVPEITDKNINVMSERDKRWLDDCNMALIGEEVVHGRNNFISEMSGKIEALERALVREKKAVERDERDNAERNGRDKVN